ncbi:efflux RND transporter periplasmic adaptor subunit [Sphingobacterium sp. SYP-B4668]|uniref:efflux RND transporter periplasmic adaptor subunit n=1 Tax=Sphingobacterium sp. SYP-B4668 TaxID=2996035 RepID=UPI0022DD92E0|nr:efflux RND transporter periplasmic adaptor subunit [Sphingobacterium sp. SYP-B4668]
MKANFIRYITFSSLAVTLYSCQETKSSESPKDDIAVIPTTKVTLLDTTITHDFITDIQAVKNVELRSRLNGFLEKIAVDEGDFVRKGQILFTINADEFKTELAKANAQLNNAIAEAKRASLEADQTQILLQKNIISRTEMDLAEAKLQAAESKVDEARSLVQFAHTRLQQCYIKAPFDGSIDRILLREGSLLTEGSLITNISDNSNVYAYFDITEQQFLSMQADSAVDNRTFRTPVTLTLANGENYESPGVAELAESEFNSQTGTISLRARFANPKLALRHGASGKINFPIHVDNMIAVHQKAVFEIQDRTFVYTVADDNTVKMTSFIPGPRIGHYYLVKEGLVEDEQVVFEGTQGLKDGNKIKPQLKEQAENKLAQK